MSQYPPPPQPDQAHYAPIYPATPSAQTQLLDAAQQEQLSQYTPPALSQGLYTKIEPTLGELAQQANQAAQHEQQQQQLQAQNASSPTVNGQPRVNRLRKACDSCSIRKVKCDESGPPCRACAALDIPCTFERPSRRRGPPNRHAEAIKRRRLGSPGVNGLPSPASPTNAAHALAALSTQQPLSAESIAPIELIEALINDFFTYIHPLCPFPHEPTFREAFSKREDFSNRPFLALLASMLASLVASFPRKPRQHLKAMQKEHLFPTHMSLVNRCQQVCSAARGLGYLERADLNVYDACTSYFLSLVGAYTFQWRQARLYMGETLVIMRGLGLTRSNPVVSMASAALAANGLGPDAIRDPIFDQITEQIGRRLFWTLIASVRTMQQWGSSLSEFALPPPTPTEPYPPLPAEVDDIHIYPNYIEEQQPGVISLLTGFVANAKIYSSYAPLVTMEMAFGIGEVFDWERQQSLLDQCLRNCKRVLETLPSDLRVWPSTQQANAPVGHQSTQPPFYPPPLSEYMSASGRDPVLFPPFDLEEQRRMQYEIQKANIHASHLSTRMYIVERYFGLLEAHDRLKQQNSEQPSPTTLGSGLDILMAQNKSGQPHAASTTEEATQDCDNTEQEMAQEREQIIKDLLIVLANISQVSMEPNGDSFTKKIRMIASSLLDVPKTRKGSVALQAEQYLSHFIDILNKLERVALDTAAPHGGVSGVADPVQQQQLEMLDEEAELRHWADLREYQQKFQQAGGVYGFV